MKKASFHFILLFLLTSCSSLYIKPSICTMAIQSCTVKKITWEQNEWVVDYSKTLNLPMACSESYPDLQLEENLGLSVSVLSLDHKPMIVADLYQGKRTYILASAKEPLNSIMLNFSHRLSSDKNSMIEVSCQ